MNKVTEEGRLAGERDLDERIAANTNASNEAYARTCQEEHQNQLICEELAPEIGLKSKYSSHLRAVVSPPDRGLRRKVKQLPQELRDLIQTYCFEAIFGPKTIDLWTDDASVAAQGLGALGRKMYAKYKDILITQCVWKIPAGDWQRAFSFFEWFPAYHFETFDIKEIRRLHVVLSGADGFDRESWMNQFLNPRDAERVHRYDDSQSIINLLEIFNYDC